MTSGLYDMRFVRGLYDATPHVSRMSVFVLMSVPGSLCFEVFVFLQQQPHPPTRASSHLLALQRPPDIPPQRGEEHLQEQARV